MIDKMKKFTFLVTNSEYDGFISKVRELGVVHVQCLQQGVVSPALQQALDLKKRYQAAIAYLKKKDAEVIKPKEGEVPVEVELEDCTPQQLLETIENIQCEEVRLQHAMDEAGAAIKAFKPWGEFDAEALQNVLAQADMQVNYWRFSGKHLKKDWEDNYFAQVIGEEDKRLYFVTFSNGNPDVQAEPIVLPEGKLSDWEAKERQLEQDRVNLMQRTLAIYERQLHILVAGMVEAENAVSLERVHVSDEAIAEGAVRMLVGWVKADLTLPLQQYLDESGIFYEESDPLFDDEVPVSLTNNGYNKLFMPILKMYSLPNYRDIDPLAYFAPFFMLFFGLCLGDAGYGLIVLCVGIYLLVKGGEKMRPFGRLACCLGGMTVFCGLITAMFFGIDLSKQDWEWLKPIQPYFLTDDGVGPIFGYSPMMVIAVFIGLVQVLIGMLLKGSKQVKNYGWPYAISTFSWFVALVSAIILFGLPFCGIELAGWLKAVLGVIIGICAVGIFLYNNPAAYSNPWLGPLKNIGGGLWATYGMSTGLLGDLLSYIRLFALGLTGGVLGGVFNTLAMTAAKAVPVLPLNVLIFVLVLLAGHGITLALSVISAFVHPMRLTFVEFFKNSDFSGNGKAYKPFQQITELDD
ncbi:MAG: hypothetical protein HUK03_04935 [Bacteroidaceae bacterium]|nr:hypothetical protein [Bacteroidaceae bacterium]